MFRSILGLVLSGIVLSCATDARAATATSAIDVAPKSFAAICSNQPARMPAGPEIARPGRYFNPQRQGQGWDFFWYGRQLPGQSPGSTGPSAQNQVGNRLFVVWYTHEWVSTQSGTRVLKPVWFGGVGDFVWPEWSSTVTSWTGSLYRFTVVEQPGSGGGLETFRQWLPEFLGGGSPSVENATPVGAVTLFFGSSGLQAGTRPSQIAARWQLNANYGYPTSVLAQESAADDCLTNFVSGSDSTEPDYYRSGVYLDQTAAGWFWTPIFWKDNGIGYEHHGFAYFDALTPGAPGQLAQGGQPRWLVGFPEPTDPNHACFGFSSDISGFGGNWVWNGVPPRQFWPICMAVSSFGVPVNPGSSGYQHYVPWLKNEPYTLTRKAALLRGDIPDGTTAPSTSVRLRTLNTSDVPTFARYYRGATLSDPAFLETATTPAAAKVAKVIGLTRARLAGGGIAQPTDLTCRVGTGESRTPGTCDTQAHWSTEGAYLNLTVRLNRESSTPPVAVEVARGLLRSPWDGEPLSKPTPQPGNQLSTKQPTSGPLVGESVTLDVYESPAAAAPIVRSPPYTISAPNGRCGDNDGVSRPLAAVSIPTAALDSSHAGDALIATASVAGQSDATRRATGIRYRLYEAIDSGGTGIGNLRRFIGQQQFALPQLPTTVAAGVKPSFLDTAVFSQVEPGKPYAVYVDLYNECGVLTSALSATRLVTLATVPDQTLADSPLPVTNHDPSVGLVPQTSGVSGGAATFEFPIEVPPGIQGMQPSLSLSYSSRAGNAIAGVGVSLSGLSSIHRCPQTRATDGAPRAVDFSNNDRLCLDGQRLIALNSAPYGQAGTTYRTEIDQYLRVTQLAGDLAVNSRAATFRVELKSGEILHFGGAFGTSLWYVPVATSPGGSVDAALSWVLRRRANRAGNFVEYRYQDFGSGEFLVSSISYSGTGSTDSGGGTAGNRQVIFTYEARPDATNSFIAGAESRQTQRLKTVRTLIGADEVRTYTLGFGGQASQSTGRTLLRTIQVCARSTAAQGGGTSCLPTTTIQWQEGTQPRVLSRVVADGGVPAPYPYTLRQYTERYRNLGEGGTTPQPVFQFDPLADLDGDGTVEHLAYTAIPGDPTSIRSRLVRYSADRSVAGAINLTPDTAERIFGIGRQSRDLNNDGRSDLWFRASPNNPDQYCSTPTCTLSVAQWIPGTVWPNPDATAAVPLSQFFTQAIPQFISDAGSDDVTPPSFGNATTYFFDLNGDGLPELLDLVVPLPAGEPGGIATTCPQVAVGGGGLLPVAMANGPELRVYQNVSQGQSVRFKVTPILKYCLPRRNGFGNFWQNWMLADRLVSLDDVDGDGLPDLKLESMDDPGSSSVDARIAFGNNDSGGFKFAAPIEFASLFAPYPPREGSMGTPPRLRHTRFGDFNGDGLQDIHAHRMCNGVLTHLVSFNTGRAGESSLYTPFYATPGPNGAVPSLGECESSDWNPGPSPHYVSVADTDADGRDEILQPASFAFRLCSLQYDPNSPPLEPTAYYYCPEKIRGQDPLPPPDPGFNPTIDVRDELYSIGKPDGSLYKAAAVRLVIDSTAGARALRLESLPGSVITNASGTSMTDLYGDSLSDGLLITACPHTAATTGPDCVIANNLLDSTGAPLDAGRYYVHESRGTYGNPGDPRAANRTPLLPDLVWEVKAAAPTGHVDGAIRVARWSYDPLSSAGGRTPNSTLPPLYSLPAPLQPPPAHFYFTSSMPVVATYWQSNGNLRSTTCTSGDPCLRHGLTRTQYGYREALYSAEGRGFRGFRTIIEQTDGLSPDPSPVITPGLRTTTVFKQSFPLSSALECQFVTSAADPIGPLACPAQLPSTSNFEGTTLLKAATATTVGILRGCAAAGSPSCYWDVQPTAQRTLSYEPTDGRWVTDTTASTTYDTYGNALTQQSTTQQVDGGGRTATQSETMVATYEPATTSPVWFVNRLRQLRTTRETSYSGYLHPPTPPDSLSKTSTQLFAYDFNAASGAGTWQVQCSETFLGSIGASVACGDLGATTQAWQLRSTTLERDGYGNPKSIRTFVRTSGSATANAQIRMASQEWGDGYFKVSEANALNHRTCFTVDPRFGTPTTVTRLMNSSQTCATPTGPLVEQTTLDAFGRPTRIVAPSNTEVEAGTNIPRPIHATQDTVLSRQWCSITGNPRPCGTLNALYRELKEQRGSPRTESYHDAAARPVLAGSTASDDMTSAPGIGTLIATTTAYDDLGRTLGVYGPSRNGSMGNTVDHYHDRFGRLRVKAERRARLDSDNASGNQHLVTIYTADRATVDIQVRACNPLAVGAVVPDAQNPVNCSPITSPVAGGQPPITQINLSRVMDPAGRPLFTADAQQGETTFQYDGNGSATAIRDPAGIYTTAVYDALGRRLSVQDPNQGTSTFDYNGLGEVMSTRNSRAQTVTYVRDQLGRVTQRVWREAAGAQQSANAHAGTDRFDYDTGGFGLLWRERRQVYSLDGMQQLDLIATPDPSTDCPPPATQPGGCIALVESYERSTLFDALYRPATVTVRLPKNPGALGSTTPDTFVTEMRYDGPTGRVKQRILPRGVSVGYSYNRHGYPEREFIPGSNEYLRRVMARDAFGNEAVVSLRNDTLRRRHLAAPTSGLTQSICYDQSSAGTADDCPDGSPLKVRYLYDAFGNVLQQQLRGGRPASNQPVAETYSYDALHRVTSATYSDGTSSDPSIRYGYSTTGNLLKKTDFSVDTAEGEAPAYAYGNVERNGIDNAGPNAVESVRTPGLGCRTDYRYDESGNQIAQEVAACGTNTVPRRQWIDYTVDNLPKWMQLVHVALPKEGDYPQSAGVALSSRFAYSPDGQRYAQRVLMGNPSRSTVYIGDYERDEVVGSTQPYIEHRYKLAPGVLLIHRERDDAGSPRSGVYYVMGDRLGSTSTVFRARDNAIVDRHGFGPFGEPRDGNWRSNASRTLHPVNNDIDLTSPAVTRRGFTQHEHLDRHLLIHMNGRLYDYQAGRFLGVDPIIQFPTNSQSLNPYSYILNNPLAGTDPTGFRACKASDDVSCLEDGLNTVSDSNGGKSTIIVGQKGDNIAFAGRGLTLKRSSADIYLALNPANGVENWIKHGPARSNVPSTIGSTADRGKGCSGGGPLQCYTVTSEMIDGESVVTSFERTLAPSGSYAAVNGMLNDVGRAMHLMANHVQDRFGVSSFMLAHNPTEGFMRDMWESTRDKVGWTTDAASQLAAILDGASEDVSWVAHSQGGAIFAEALRYNLKRGVTDMSNIRVAFHAGANNRWVTDRYAARTGLQVVGYFDAPNDAVPQVIGLRALLRPDRFLQSILSAPLLFRDGSRSCQQFCSPHTNAYQP
ncbi:conserved exported hypothetical protein [uncultured Defluviicoccus sp.]|uniref:Insecticide toxin TcdB middle/N-terminal domain-containing protein n=1 Tax=metagenome TaxID=256318 RepID=A0A380TL91_9ZZZZ|nr:conserved exported hypothetical protein [uncultured Defluviicoccus sp.]